MKAPRRSLSGACDGTGRSRFSRPRPGAEGVGLVELAGAVARPSPLIRKRPFRSNFTTWLFCPWPSVTKTSPSALTATSVRRSKVSGSLPATPARPRVMRDLDGGLELEDLLPAPAGGLAAEHRLAGVVVGGPDVANGGRHGLGGAGRALDRTAVSPSVRSRPRASAVSRSQGRGAGPAVGGGPDGFAYL